MKTLTPLRRIAEDFLHYIAPSICAGCGAPVPPGSSLLCDGCHASIEMAPYPEEIFGSVLETAGNDEPLELDGVGSLFSFSPTGPVREIIHAIKYRGCGRLAVELGRETGSTLAIFPEFHEIDVVVPIPLHPARLRERGYNQAERIGVGIADSMQASLLPQGLVRTRNTRSQTQLDNEGRRKNTRGVFVSNCEEVVGRVVLLCDDVLTTGATLREGARALLQQGAKRVVGGTLAFDDISGDDAGDYLVLPIP